MRAVSAEKLGVRPDGKEIMQVMILADTTPSTLPTDGTNVTGLTSNHVFAPFSLLYVVGEADSKVYIANESGHFVAQ
jgi:hypothetical protein